MAAFGRLIGLEFTAQETAQAGNNLAGYRRDYAALRANRAAFELAPSTAFDPYPLSARAAAPAPPVPPKIPDDVELPAADADLAFMSVLELASLLRQKKLTSRRMTELALARLQRFDEALLCVVNALSEHAL